MLAIAGPRLNAETELNELNSMNNWEKCSTLEQVHHLEFTSNWNGNPLLGSGDL